MGGGKGGSLGGGKSRSRTSSSSTNKTADQKKWLTEALALYGPELGKNKNVWGGDRVVPFSTLQQGAIEGAGNFADLFSTPQQVGTPLFGKTGAALTGILSGETGAKKMGSQDVQDYFKSTMYDPTMTSLREDVLPGVDDAYSGPGFYGSARSHAKQKATENTRDLLAQQWGGLNWDVQQQNQAIDEAKAGRSLAAIPQGMAFGQVPAQEVKNNLQIAASQIGGLNALFGIGQSEQTQEQAELQSAIMKFAEENAITDPENLAIMMTLLGMNFGTSGSVGKSSGWNWNGSFQG